MDEEAVIESAFDSGNFEPVVIISLARIYDLLAVIARGINKEEAERMIELHSQGFTLSPPPAFRMTEEESSD